MTDTTKVEPTTPDTGVKKWWESTTIRGIIVGAICKGWLVIQLAFKLAGIELPALPAGLEGVLGTAIALVGSFIGDIVTLIGRIKATQKIG